LLNRVDQRFDQTLPLAGETDLPVRRLDAEITDRALLLGPGIIAAQAPTGRDRGELGIEQPPDLARRDLPARPIRLPLDDVADDRMHPLRQRDAVIALEHERDAALARLAVDAHDLLVAPPEIARIDRQIRHF